jgi:hypothetical protein
MNAMSTALPTDLLTRGTYRTPEMVRDAVPIVSSNIWGGGGGHP